jgi:hypothetical protein
MLLGRKPAYLEISAKKPHRGGFDRIRAERWKSNKVLKPA